MRIAIGVICACLTALAQTSAQDRSPREKPAAITPGGLPLKPERKVEFTTDEGTWMSVDVSPDGKRLLFDLLGDIYELPIEGGTARRLLGGMAYESQPKYSPDGSSIAFVSDRDGADNLWIARADGSEARNISHEDQGWYISPVWAPDGKSIFVLRGNRQIGIQIWTYNVAGGKPVRVTTGKDSEGATPVPHSVTGPVVSPDGRYVYYAHHPGRLAGTNLVFPQWQIARLDRTSGIEEIITHEQGGAFRPVLSPEGKKLIYGTRHDAHTGLRILDLTTDADRWLKYPIQHDDQEEMLYPSLDLLPGYAFTPDGKSIIATYGGKIHRIDVASGGDRLIPFQVNVSQDLGPLLNFPDRVEDGPVHARLIQEPAESPDGKHLAFSALAHLYVKDLPDGKPRRLTASETGEYQPVWSPDGQWIAYVTWSSAGGSLWKLRADGKSAPQRLTAELAYYRELQWSPDGSRIVVLKSPVRAQLLAQRGVPSVQPPPNQHIVWIPSKGGEIHDLGLSRGLRHPQFTNDTQRIYMHNGHELISMDFNGENRKTHLNVTGTGAGNRELGVAHDLRVSPDGKWALVVFQSLFSQMYLAPIPETGQSVKVNVTSSGAKKLALTGVDYFGFADQGKTVWWAAGNTYFRQPFSASTSELPPIQRIVADVEAPREQGRGVIVLKNAKVITMHGEDVIDGADIVVKDNRIQRVGRSGSVAIPAGAKVWDMRGKTILPGFIDTHDHWYDMQRDILELQHWDFLATLAFGVTTGRDPQTETNDAFAYQDLADTGQILGPRGFSAGQGIFWMADIRTPEQAYDIAAKYRDFYRTKTIKSYLTGNRTQRQLLLQAARKAHLMPTVEGQSDLKMDITHIIDGFSGNEHLLPTVPIYKDVAELVARSGVFYTPTLVVTSDGPQTENYFFTHFEIHDDPKVRRFIPHYLVDAKTMRKTWVRESEYTFPEVAKGLEKIVRAGGRVCVGSHGQMQGIAFHWEMWAMATGMSNMEVLRAATQNGADAIGYGQDLGSIEVGKLADLVILDRDPLEDIHNTTAIAYVMKGGEMFEGSTLNQVWPMDKPLQKLWWWDDVPNH